MQKYQHSVIAVCEALSGHARGSRDGLQDETLQGYLEWLRWRVSDEAWDPSPSGRSASVHEYDTVVRNLALAALKLVEDPSPIILPNKPSEKTEGPQSPWMAWEVPGQGIAPKKHLEEG